MKRRRAATAAVNQHNVGVDDRYFMGGRLAHNIALGERGALFVGADLRRDKGDGYRRRYMNDVPTDNYLVNLNMDLVTYGLFAQGQYRPADSIKLLAGVRYDAFHYDIDNRKLPAASARYHGSVVTPKFGLAWSPLRELDLFANVAEGFRSPAAQQMSPGGGLGPLGAPGGIANTSIQPSKVRSYDVGFTVRPVPDWTLSGAAYYVQNEDEIVLTAPDTYSSVGETTRKGFELETRYRVSPAFDIYASYGRILEAEIKNPLPGSGARLSVPRGHPESRRGVSDGARAGASHTPCRRLFDAPDSLLQRHAAARADHAELHPLRPARHLRLPGLPGLGVLGIAAPPLRQRGCLRDRRRTLDRAPATAFGGAEPAAVLLTGKMPWNKRLCVPAGWWSTTAANAHWMACP